MPRNQDNFTQCYQSNPKSGMNNCRYPLTACEVCKRIMCRVHADTFSHALTCRPPEETEAMLKKYGLLKDA